MQAVQILRDGSAKLLKAERSQALFKGNDCVYILSANAYEQFIISDPSIKQHSDKVDKKPLAQYLLSNKKSRRETIEAIFAPFSSVGRLQQAAARLLEHARECDFPCIMVVGVPEKVYHQLLKQKDLPREEEDKEASCLESDIVLSPYQQELLREVAQSFCGIGRDAERVRMQIVEAAANNTTTVTILGDTGTGKEVVARLIHRYSRNDEKFIIVNCGAIPETLFESELFGYEPYAFSGASIHGKQGLWEVANGGTLFLDEIGDLPPEAQVKILRALENKVIRRIGGTEDIKVNARVIVATHRNLKQMVEEGTFREDLFYRLRVLVIRTPSITDNYDHLAQDIQSFWRDVTEGKGPEFSPQVLDLLAKRSWTGNYRDLKNFLRALWEHWRLCNRKQVLPIHVRTIEERYGPSPKVVGDALGARVNREVWRMRYMQHHAMCAEALRALQLTLEPMTKRGGSAPDDLELRLRRGIAELALLLDKPHRFYNPDVFHAIDAARAAVGELLELLRQKPAKVHTFAKRNTLPKIDAGLDATFRGT